MARDGLLRWWLWLRQDGNWQPYEIPLGLCNEFETLEVELDFASADSVVASGVSLDGAAVVVRGAARWRCREAQREGAKSAPVRPGDRMEWKPQEALMMSCDVINVL